MALVVIQSSQNKKSSLPDRMATRAIPTSHSFAYKIDSREIERKRPLPITGHIPGLSKYFHQNSLPVF